MDHKLDLPECDFFADIKRTTKSDVADQAPESPLRIKRYSELHATPHHHSSARNPNAPDGNFGLHGWRVQKDQLGFLVLSPPSGVAMRMQLAHAEWLSQALQEGGWSNATLVSEDGRFAICERFGYVVIQLDGGIKRIRPTVAHDLAAYLKAIIMRARSQTKAS